MEHDKAPHERLLQRRLAEEITVMVHSREDYDTAVRASEILFGNATKETLSSVDEETFLSVFDGVPMAEVSKSDFDGTTGLLDLLVSKCGFFKSNGELRKLIQSGGLSINKEKVSDPQYMPTTDDLVEGSYMLIQKGKKNYFLVHAV